MVIHYLKNLYREEPNWVPLKAMLEFYTGDSSYYPTGLFSRRRFSFVDAMIKEKELGRAIDIGCSWGLTCVSAAKKKYSVIALDVYAKLLCQLVLPHVEYHEVNHKVSGVIGLCEFLPFASESFDIALCGEIIEHLPAPAKLIGEVNRILKPGGEVIITTPNAASLPRRLLSYELKLGVTEEHIHEFTPRELISLIERDTSLKVIELKLICPNIYPLGNFLFNRFPYRFLRRLYYWISTPIERIPHLNLMLCDTMIIRCQKKGVILSESLRCHHNL